MKHLKLTTLLTLVMTLSGISSQAQQLVTPEPNIYDNVKIISPQTIISFLSQRLLDENLSEDLEITLRGHEKGVQLKSTADKYHMTLENLTLQRENRRFTALLSFTSVAGTESVEVDGRYEEFTRIPVVTTKVPYNEPVKEENIDWVRYATHRLKHDTILDDGELIGQAAKRSLSALRPIRMSDLIRPQIVSRNDVVDMLHRTGALEVRTVGVALEDGSKGEIIRVRNSSSNKIIQAVIEDERLVTTLATFNK